MLLTPEWQVSEQRRITTKHWENQHHAIRLWGNTSGMVSQTVCYTGVCTYSSTVLLVVFCLHFLQSLICFVQQFLNVLSVLLLHLKLLLLKLSQLVIQLKGVKFICVLYIVLIKIPALRLEKRRDRVKQNKQTKRKESWYFS